MKPKASGYFSSGIPYNRGGHGRRILVIFQGLLFENKPQSRMILQPYKFLERDYTIYCVLPRPRLPAGYTMKNMADDYAAMIREEFGGAVDVLGVSTGGSIAQHFAADHPDLVRKLVIHSSAFTLSEEAKRFQLHLAQLAEQRRWREAYAAMLDFMLRREGVMKYLAGPVIWLGSLMASRLFVPKDGSDMVVTVEAEDKHDFKGRLHEIKAPTLVIAGDRDPFYTETLFRETAAGIPNGRLILYEGVGHPAGGKQFGRDVLEFLREDCDQG